MCKTQWSAWPAFLILLSPLCPAATQEPAETLVVTATRTAQSRLLVGGSLTIIDAAELQRRQRPLLADVLRDVPGFAVSRSGAPGAVTQLRVRGAEGNHVLVLIDGVEANDPAQGGEFNFAHLLTGEIERIEILRGPQSALWGSDALAGTINLITRRGAPGGRLEAFTEGGSFGTWHAGASLSGAGPRHRLRVAAARYATRGSNIAREGSERDGYHNTTLSAVAGWNPRPWLALDASWRHVAGNNEFDDVGFATGLPEDADRETRLQQDYARLQGRITPQGGRWEHRVLLGLGATANDNFTDGRAADSTRGRRQKASYQGSLNLDSGHWAGVRHVLSLALEYENEDYRQRGTATQFGDPNRDLDLQTRSVAAEYRLESDALFSLAAGYRHDRNSDFAAAGSWRITGAWLPPGLPLRLRGACGTGRKNPGFVERFGFFAAAPTPFFGNAALRPERSTACEAGLDFIPAGGRLHAGLTWYRQDLEDEIDGFAFDPGLGGFTAVNLDGQSRRRGVELSATLQLVDNVSLRGTYSWLHASEPAAEAGERQGELRRPGHAGSFGLDYEFGGGRGRFNFNAQYSGAQRDLYFPPPSFAASRVRLDAFVLLHAAASWRIGERLEVFGRVENLSDASYEEVFGFRGQGLGAFAGLRFATGR